MRSQRYLPVLVSIVATIKAIVNLITAQDYHYPQQFVYPPYRSNYIYPTGINHVAIGYGTLPFSVSPQCDYKVLSDPEYQKCRTEAIINWGTNVDAQDKIKYRCCYYWDLLDCFETAVQASCTRNEHAFEDSYRTFAVRKEEMLASQRYLCVDYEYGSIKCWFYWWVIAIIVLVAFVLMLIIAWIFYLFFRKKKKPKQTPVKTVKVKTTDIN